MIYFAQSANAPTYQLADTDVQFKCNELLVLASDYSHQRTLKALQDIMSPAGRTAEQLRLRGKAASSSTSSTQSAPATTSTGPASTESDSISARTDVQNAFKQPLPTVHLQMLLQRHLFRRAAAPAYVQAGLWCSPIVFL